MLDEVERIERGISALEVIIGEREDGIRYLPFLRRLRRERDRRMDDQAEVEALRRARSRWG